MRVTFLAGADTASTRQSILQVCALSGIEPAGILLDTHVPSGRQRYKNLRRNFAREGWRYLPRRLSQAFLEKLETWAVDLFVDARAVDVCLRRAFPERLWTLDEIAARYHMPLLRVGHLNEPKAAEALRGLNADLGIVIGTRILKPSIFSLPRLGSVNLHKGKLPEYRGMPPGFWELHAGEKSAGVTVHFVDAGLDTGDIVATGNVDISPNETPETLRVKLDWKGAEVLGEAVAAIAAGTTHRQPQPKTAHKAHTRPTAAEQAALAVRLPHWRRKKLFTDIARQLLYFAFYFGQVYRLKRALRPRARAAILLYHRVNDWSVDPLSTSERRFAEHLLLLKRFYQPISTAQLLADLQAGKAPAPDSVLVHFDDCYRDVATAAAPILEAAGFSATAFISTGFLDTERVFDHDRRKYAHRYPNMTSDQLRGWRKRGLEVAAHTVNHRDLGAIPLSEAQHEVEQCRRHLESLLQEPVRLFSFPFGGTRNMRPEVAAQVRQAGYEAMFSAHGGFVWRGCDLYDIPRLGAHEQSPLTLLMELEGLSLGQLRGADYAV